MHKDIINPNIFSSITASIQIKDRYIKTSSANISKKKYVYT